MGQDFPSGDLFCKWGVSHGSGWRVLEGLKDGQTQIYHSQLCGGFAVSHDFFLLILYAIGKGYTFSNMLIQECTQVYNKQNITKEY